MLQRIQTVYILISALLMGALYMWFPSVLDITGTPIVDKSEPLVFGFDGWRGCVSLTFYI